MSILLLICSVLAVIFVLYIERFTRDPLLFVFSSLQMAVGPTLYFYTRILTHIEFRWRWQHLWHFLPTLCLGLLWYSQLPLSPSGLFTVSCAEEANCSLLYQSRIIHRIAAWISIISYSTLSLNLLRPHLQRMKVHYTSIEEVSLRWLKTLVFLLLLCTLLAIIGDFRGYMWGSHEITGGMVLALTPFFLSLSMGWFGIQQRNIPEARTPLSDVGIEPLAGAASRANSSADKPSTAGKKYQTSSLTKENTKAIWQQLQQLMSNDAPYLVHGLKISDLAQKMGVSVNHLSETINGYSNQSFYDFVNKYRVEEAIVLLSDSSQQHLSVTDIGYQVGFNSSSAFYTHFKTYQNMAPKQYRNQLLRKN